MRYMGGKHRQSKIISKAIVKTLNENQDIKSYYEPFVGGNNIIPLLIEEKIFSDCYAYASDSMLPLISLHNSMKNGWIPPEEVTEIDYDKAKKLPDTDPLKAFIGFGCSFGGAFFNGFSKNTKTRNYASNASNSLKKKFRTIAKNRERINFYHADYKHLIPDMIPKSIIYLDPPYHGTSKYKNTSFSSSDFWPFAQKLAKRHIVFVTEFNIPVKNTIIHRFTRKTTLHRDTTKSKERTEILARLHSA